MKIQSSKVVNATVSYSFGDLVFENGIAEIDDKFIEAIKAHRGITLLEEETKKEVNEDKNLDYKKELLLMKKEELVELAKQSNLPEEEFINLNKNKLIDYLVSKIA